MSTLFKCPSGNSGCDTSCFRIGKEKFFVLARKSRDCAEAYYRTPHKQSRRLTPPGRKRALSGRKLVRNRRKERGGNFRLALPADFPTGCRVERPFSRVRQKGRK